MSQMLAERIAAYPSSVEINRILVDPTVAIERVLRSYRESALGVDYTDGISVEFKTWRFNLRCSNTEPVVRLNVETKGDLELMKLKTAEVLSILGS